MGFDTPSGGGGAPTDGPYLTSGADPDLSNETVVSNPENAPEWTEDDNSPFTATSATSITASIADGADAYLVFLEATDVDGAGTNGDMQVDGRTSTDYRYVTKGGTQTTGDTSFPNIPVMASNDATSVTIPLKEFVSQIYAGVRGTGATTGAIQEGVLSIFGTWPPSQVSFSRGVATDWSIRVYGFSLPTP